MSSTRVSPFLDSMATWDLGITIVIVYVLLVVVVVDTCIRAPVAANKPLIVVSFGMADVS